MLILRAQTGLRASELTGLRCGDIHLGVGAHATTTGKGRKQRILHADLALKERALARTTPLDSKPGRYRSPDALLRFLDGL